MAATAMHAPAGILAGHTPPPQVARSCCEGTALTSLVQSQGRAWVQRKRRGGPLRKHRPHSAQVAHAVINRRHMSALCVCAS